MKGICPVMEKMTFSKYLNNSKPFFTSWGLGLLALAMPMHAFATGGGDDCANMECNSTFAPEVIGKVSEAPFFKSYHTLYGVNQTTKERRAALQNLNTLEWSSFFGYMTSTASMDYLLYSISADDLVRLQNAFANGQSQGLPPAAKDVLSNLNRMLRNSRPQDVDAIKKQIVAALKYIAFAKDIEPLATRNSDIDSWDTPDVKPPADVPVDELVAKSNALIKEIVADDASKAFLVQRYRLQVIRLYYYMGLYDKAQAYYASHVREFGSLLKDPKAEQGIGNSAKYRFLDYAAGSFYKSAGAIFTKQKNLGKGETLSPAELAAMTKGFSTANYLYSLIFDQFEPLKTTSYLSFHPMENADWLATLAMAKTTNEKEILWQLLGIYADGQSAIETIYALNPASQTLPLLLVREVNKAEESWSNNQEHIKHPEYFDPNDKVVSDAEAIGVKRLATIERIANAGKAAQPYLWDMAAGHLSIFAGNTNKALAYLNKAEMGAAKDNVLAKSQIRLSKLLLSVRGLKEVNPLVESKLVVDLTWLDSYKSVEANYRASTVSRMVSEQLSSLYAKKGDKVRALWLNDDSSDDFYRDNAKLDSMIALSENPTTPFDSYLASRSKYSLGQLQELKALNSLYAGNLADANESFARVGAEISDQVLNADPFMIHIKDDHDADFEAAHNKYTKVTFAKRMLELSRLALGNDKLALDASFELANGYYNMSYFGNGRDIYDTEFGNLRARARDNALNAETSLKMDLAKKFYQRALDLAVKNKANQELQAKLTWMLAKVERNEFINNHPSLSFDDKLVTEYLNTSKTVKSFADKFNDTQYFKEVIKECGYFNSYVSR